MSRAFLDTILFRVYQFRSESRFRRKKSEKTNGAKLGDLGGHPSSMLCDSYCYPVENNNHE